MQRKNEDKKGNNGYISLNKAAEYSGCYSQEYLSLRARQGKLKAIKIARNWLTKKEWIDEYVEKVNNNYKNRASDIRKIQKKEIIKPTLIQPVSPRAIAVVVALVFVLVSVGTLFAYPYFSPVLKSVANPIKDGAIEVVSDIGEFTSDIGEGIVEAGDNISENIFDFTTNVSVGARPVRDLVVKGPKKFVARISNGASLMAEKITNKWARSQRFVSDTFVNLERGIVAYGVGVKEGAKEFGALISGGVDENLVSPVKNFTASIVNDLTKYISQDARAIKKGFQILAQKTKQVPQKVISVFRGRETISREDFGLKQKKEEIGKFIRDIGGNIHYKIGLTQKFVMGVVQGVVQGVAKGIGEVVKGAKLLVRIVDENGRFIGSKFGDAYRFITQLWHQEVAKREEAPKEEVFFPKPEKEGLIVIPSTEEDEEIKQKIKASFSDEVRVEPKDKTSGIIIPIFREREGQKYLYLMVPVKE